MKKKEIISFVLVFIFSLSLIGFSYYMKNTESHNLLLPPLTRRAVFIPLDMVESVPVINWEDINQINKYIYSTINAKNIFKSIEMGSGHPENSLDGKMLSLLSEQELERIAVINRADTVFYGDILFAGERGFFVSFNTYKMFEGVVDKKLFYINLGLNGAGVTPWKENRIIKIGEKEDITVMIDPGHGGKDTGAEKFGFVESEMNSKMAALLADSLRKRGYRVIFTREPSDDRYIDLYKRAKIINTANPDLCISLHHDFSESSDFSGYSIFYGSFKQKLDNKDLYIRIDDNWYTHTGTRHYRYYNRGWKRGYYYTFVDEEGDVQSTRGLWYRNVNPYLRDLTPSAPALAGQKMAILAYLELNRLDFIKPNYYMKNRIISDHEYAIFRETTVPVVLIECAFVTNKSDMKQLNAPGRREEFTESIARGVDNYFGRAK